MHLNSKEEGGVVEELWLGGRNQRDMAQLVGILVNHEEQKIYLVQPGLDLLVNFPYQIDASMTHLVKGFSFGLLLPRSLCPTAVSSLLYSRKLQRRNICYSQSIDDRSIKEIDKYT